MDVVRLSGASAIAACAVLALVSSTSHGFGQPQPLAAETVTPPLRPARRIDEAFTTAERAPAFTLSGLAMLTSPSTGPTIYGASLFRRSPFANPSGSTWDPLVNEASRRFGIPSAWVRGVMQVESGGRTTLNGRPITSPVGATGLMQVMPETFAELSVRYGLGSDPYEPRANILAGAAYLREMYDRFGAAHFLAAYNAGPGRVYDYLWRGRPLPFETQRYVQALAPQLVGSGNGDSSASPSAVRNLTSREAMRDAASFPSRRSPILRRSAETASLFVAENAPSSTRDRQDEATRDGLFVRLTHQDQRRDAPTSGGPED